MKNVAALAMIALRPHTVIDEDCWYSCPMSGQCCNDELPEYKCNCGAASHNAEVLALVDDTENHDIVKEKIAEIDNPNSEYYTRFS